MPGVDRFVCHSRRVLRIALKLGWKAGVQYTNLRNVRGVDEIGFLDIDWKAYDFKRHLEAARATRPGLTVAHDVTDEADLERVVDQASDLARFAERVVIVPKDKKLEDGLEERVPQEFWFGYSVPTRYGATPLSPHVFRRPVHLLGGRPDVQRRIAEMLPVVSLDCNRFTIDACYGDYFDGDGFRPHPVGGYERCIADSIQNVNNLWREYRAPRLET